MKILRSVMYCCLSMGFATGCYYDNKEDLYQNLGPDGCDTSNVTYSTVIQPIITENCAVPGCHVPPFPSGGRDFRTYEGVKASAEAQGIGSLIGRVTATTGSIMPQAGPLPKCDIDKLRIWVADGAPNN